MYRLELLALPFLFLLGQSNPLQAQVREVVSSQIAVSSDDATLRLELASEESVEISLRNGSVLVDGESVGSFSRGDALDVSWRSLLGQAVALDDGPLAQALIEWTPPDGPSGAVGDVATRLDRALEERLTAPPGDAPAGAAAPEATGGAPAGGDQGSELTSLLRRADRLGVLAEAVEGLDLGQDTRIEVGEDVTVGEDVVIPGSLVVVDGDLDVRGTVRGDVVVTGGTLRLGENGRIGGEVRLADAELSRNGGTLGGSVTEIPDSRIRLLERLERLENLEGLEELDNLDDLEEDIRARVRDEIRREMGSDFGRRNGGGGITGPLRSIGRGVGGLVQNVVSFLVLMVLALGVARFFPENLRRVEAAAGANPGRSALVGLAGVFLFLPVYVLGMLALVVSIVGIPALLAWIPLFPLAAAAAAVLGNLAVAVLIGRWILRQEFRGLEFLRRGNDIHAAAAGIAALLLPYAVANVVQMGGSWLGFAQALFTAVGVLAGALALLVGFGAVLVTRGGRRLAYPGGDPFGGGTSPEREGPTGPAADPEWDPNWEEEWEEEWEDEWEDLEREARHRAAGPEDEGAGTDGEGAGGTGGAGGAGGTGPGAEPNRQTEVSDEKGRNEEKSGDA